MAHVCPCPSCVRRFESSRAVNRHLKVKGTPCYVWYLSSALLSEPVDTQQLLNGSSDNEHHEKRATVKNQYFSGTGQRPSKDTESESDDTDSECDESEGSSSAASLSEHRGFHVEFHPTPGQAFDRALTIFEHIHVNDDFAASRKENRYYPFSCKLEWGLVVWLSQSGLSTSEIDKFLKLPYVSSIYLVFMVAKLISVSYTA